MPETCHTPVTVAQFTASLAGLIHGPYSDDATTDAAALATETIRYLNHATRAGGITDPATIAALTANLADAVYRLPQLLNQTGDWLIAETTAGRIADDHHRQAWQLTDATRTILGEAVVHAAALARTLNAAQNLTATLHTTQPASRQLWV
jgi:hypothetical protein